MSLDIELVLAPVDSSDDAEAAAAYALAIAHRYDAALHLLHVFDERVVRGLETGDLAAETVAEQQRSFTGEIRGQEGASEVDISQSTVLGFSTSRLSLSPGSAILDAAEELDADFLVVPRISPGEAPDAILGKAALYVLEYASQPVLSV